MLNAIRTATGKGRIIVNGKPLYPAAVRSLGGNGAAHRKCRRVRRALTRFPTGRTAPYSKKLFGEVGASGTTLRVRIWMHFLFGMRPLSNIGNVDA